MSFFTSKMKLLSAIVIEEKSETVTRELLKLGVLDFVEISKLFKTGDFNLKNSNDNSAGEMSELRRKLETIYHQAEMEIPFRENLDVEQVSEYDSDTSRNIIEKASADLQNIREKQKKLYQENLKLKEIIEYLGSPGSSKNNKFLLIHKGKPERGSFDEMIQHLNDVPFFGTELSESDSYFLVTLRRDQALVNEVFDKYQWNENEVQIRNNNESERLLENIRVSADKIKSEIEESRSAMKNSVLNNKEQLDDLWKNIRIKELFGLIRYHFSHTERTCLFSGWLPAATAPKVEAAIRKASENECIIEWSEPEEFKRESVPVEIKHSKVFAPFQMLVENYSIPEYGTVDPTVLVALTYMIMFGLMFGDAGQGIVIMLIGIFGRRLMKKASAGVRKLLQLFIYCGAASITAGILFGSYFGYEIFPALWFDYHAVVSGHTEIGHGSINNVYDILRITIYFGISVIGIGLLLNWINLYRKKDYFNLFLNKSGIIGGWFYGCGVYTSFYYVGTGYKSFPPGNMLAIFFGIPVLILLFKAPLNFYLHERSHKTFGVFSIIDFIMEWIVEILEIFSGYLANTLSFMRVAGLGIAHVSLMVAFDTIAGMTHGAGSIIILIIGNILVIALEGLSAGIQALRLNYYEFFSRYFTGNGIAYNPVSLRNRKQE